jgi:hypothetical protein
LNPAYSLALIPNNFDLLANGNVWMGTNFSNSSTTYSYYYQPLDYGGVIFYQ